MALGGGERFGEEPPDSVSGEAGPCGKEILVDSLCPSRDGRTRTGSMEELNELRFCLLLVCAVGVMLIAGMMGREWSGQVRRFEVNHPQTIRWITHTDDGSDAVLDDTGKFAV